VELLEPVTQPYAWGSHTAIAELQGRAAPTVQPEAELWMGAHPSAPSRVALPGGAQTTLDAMIAADPVGELGAECAARFGGRLPFLLKVLAAQKALSIQVHPSRAQAQAGFRAENERGLAPGDQSRNYVDDWPKPEILCALTPFEILAGMRTPADAATLLEELGVTELHPVVKILADAAGPWAASGALAMLLARPQAEREPLVDGVVSACARLAAQEGPYAAACAAAVRIAGEHPGDLGIIASLLLRHSVLAPGQAVFLPAGGLHAYLHGTGIELLANSDNVVRAGLTPKHIDVPELLTLTDPAVAVPVIEPRPLGDGVFVYDSPAPEFRLYRAEVGVGEITLPPAGGPRVVLCANGAAVLHARANGAAVPHAGAAVLHADGAVKDGVLKDGVLEDSVLEDSVLEDSVLEDSVLEDSVLEDSVLKVKRGESCYLSAADGTVTAAGPAVLFIAATGL
jgi:mannose-6-phosphate isomerase